MRVDANVSINKLGEPLGIRTEIKNIGSVRAVANAINYEIKRQINEREKGNFIVNETRAWNSIKNKTVSMRMKEEKLVNKNSLFFVNYYRIGLYLNIIVRTIVLCQNQIYHHFTFI